MELQQTINEKQISHQVAKLTETERVVFGGESPVSGTGRSSSMLRQTLSEDGRVYIDIVDTLKDAPIRTGTNAVLDQELKDTLSVVVDVTRGDLSLSSEVRLSRLRYAAWRISEISLDVDTSS